MAQRPLIGWRVSPTSAWSLVPLFALLLLLVVRRFLSRRSSLVSPSRSHCLLPPPALSTPALLPLLRPLPLPLILPLPPLSLYFSLPLSPSPSHHLSASSLRQLISAHPFTPHPLRTHTYRVVNPSQPSASCASSHPYSSAAPPRSRSSAASLPFYRAGARSTIEWPRRRRPDYFKN